MRSKPVEAPGPPRGPTPYCRTIDAIKSGPRPLGRILWYSAARRTSGSGHFVPLWVAMSVARHHPKGNLDQLATIQCVEIARVG